MSREVSDDFNDLTKFLKDYKLDHLLTEKEFLKNLSMQHKKFYSYLTLVTELKVLAKNTKLKPNILNNQIQYIIESCSDAGSALFLMTHGAYKAAKLVLRSSIETFLKGFNLDEIIDIDKEKSIYTIFEKIRFLPFFSVPTNKSIFNSIHQDYKTLCSDTHTATTANMQHITALKYFPAFDKKNAEVISEIYIRLIKNYNTLLCLKYKEQFQSIHHKNKTIIITQVLKKSRQVIYGFE